MILNRVDGEKKLNKEVETLDIKVNGKRFRLTERFGKLRIHASDGYIEINPCCANEIDVSSSE